MKRKKIKDSFAVLDYLIAASRQPLRASLPSTVIASFDEAKQSNGLLHCPLNSS